MNDISPTPPGEQLMREQCRIGDWVGAIHVPEWRDASGEQIFRPQESIVISPALAQYGGIAAPAGHPGEWRFAPARRDGKAVWLRSA